MTASVKPGGRWPGAKPAPARQLFPPSPPPRHASLLAAALVERGRTGPSRWTEGKPSLRPGGLENSHVGWPSGCLSRCVHRSELRLSGHQGHTHTHNHPAGAGRWPGGNGCYPRASVSAPAWPGMPTQLPSPPGRAIWSSEP